MAKWSRTQIEVMARASGWGSRSRDVSYVAMAESSGDDHVVNSIGCVGLLQINQPVHVGSHPKWTRKWLQDPMHNLAAGLVLYKAAGSKFDGPWLDSRDKGSGGGWGQHVSGSGGATQVDDPCADIKGDAKKYCEEGQQDPNAEIPFDPNAGGEGGSLMNLAFEVGRLAQVAAKGANWIADPANWVRVAYVVGGGVLAIAAVNMVARPYLNPALQAIRQVVPTQTIKKMRGTS